VARTRYALYASASFHGQAVEDTFASAGEAVQLGNSPALAIPTPAGLPYVARVSWTGPASCSVHDGTGAVHALEPGRDVVLEMGPLALRLALIEQFPVRRAEPWSFTASLAWFAICVLSSLVVSQLYWLLENQCTLALTFLPDVADVGRPLSFVIPLAAGLVVAVVGLVSARTPRRALPALAAPMFALLVPTAYAVGGFHVKDGETALLEDFAYCFDTSDAAGAGAFTAEYLGRILREDLDGEDVGVVEYEIDRPEAERKVGEHDVFVPAGAPGPYTGEMGGAAEVARTPVRVGPSDPDAITPRRVEEQIPLAAEHGVPLAAVPDERDGASGAEDGIADAEEEAREARDVPAEEEKGWGIPDWYDEEDEALDELQIEVMLHAARSRLRIDPDDPDALSLLSYYQYLAEDYDGAMRTYDRFIELYPESAAGYNNKALVYKRQGEYRKEEGLYRVALALDPGDTTALNNLAVNLSHQGRNAEALAVMEEIEATDPDDPYADLHRAKIHAQMGQEEEALAWLEKALQGMGRLDDVLHQIEFRQDIRVDPSFETLRQTRRFRAILDRYYGKYSPLKEE
jgi:tetratricopeptide (TPR) repeat protein